MIRSMTGFGQASRTINDYHIQVDIKSVNHRYQEIQIRMPRQLLQVEELAKKEMQQSIKRGRVDVFITMEKAANSTKDVQLNIPLVEGYLEAARKLNKLYGIEQTLTAKDILLVPDAVIFQEKNAELDEHLTQHLMDCVQEALHHLIIMRETEGEFLHTDVSSRLELLKNHKHKMLLLAPQANKEYQDKLRRRIEEMLSVHQTFDENRFTMEIAMMAERSNIDEELTRLSSHFSQCEQLLNADELVGRKLDFLVQEMNREVNTIGSKANHSDLTNIVVDMKAELEKIREQIQNME